MGIALAIIRSAIFTQGIIPIEDNCCAFEFLYARQLLEAQESQTNTWKSDEAIR